MAKKNRFFIRETLLPFCYAFFLVALIGAIAFFGFRYRSVSERAAEESPRQGTRIVKYSDGRFSLNDPSIPARGDANVGFAAYAFGDDVRIVLPPEKNPSEATENAAKLPEVPRFPEERVGFFDFMPDFSLPAPLPGNNFSIRRGDGTVFPVGKYFADIPAGEAHSHTMVRIIPVGGAALYRLSLAESCGNAALDAYALRELAKIKFDKGGVVCIHWGTREGKK